MARQPSKRASETKSKKDTAKDAVTEDVAEAGSNIPETAEDAVATSANAPPQEAEVVASADETPDETPLDGASEKPADDTSTTDAETTEDVKDPDSPDDTASSETSSSDETETDLQAEPQSEPESEPAPPAPAPAPVVEKRGPGFVPLVIGGVVAAAIGYFASVSGLLPGAGGEDTSEIESVLAQQSEALTALSEQMASLEPAEAPTIDLSPVTDEIASIGARIDETASAISELTDRVATLEERPVFTGDVAADAAEAAEAVAAMEEQMRAQEEEVARLAAEAEEATRAADEAIAAAESEAAAAMAAAEAEAALNELRLAVTQGDPFAEPLATVAAITEVPDALNAAAETGVPNLEALQDAFPAAARAALPIALRETAGEGTLDRMTAFIQGQIGGRAVTPREGNEPDAILSRVQAAVTAGDLDTALTEVAALPEGAQSEMAGWIAEAEARNTVVAALNTVADAVTGAN